MRKTKKKSAQRSSGLKKIAKRLAAYSAAAAATVVASQDRSANAGEIVHDLIPDVTTGNYPGLLFNVISGATALAPASTGNSATGSFRIASYNGFPYIAGPANSVAAGFVGPGGFGPDDFYLTRLSVGDPVSSLKNFGAETVPLVYGPYGYLSNFVNARGFVGLQFDIGGSLHYGWADMTNLGSNNGTILHAFGYNSTAGAASHPVPEPSSIMLLAAGAAGLAGWRRRRAGRVA